MRVLLYLSLIAAGALTGAFFALRTGPLMQPNPEYGACWTWSATDALTPVVLVGAVVLFVGFILLLARHERRGTLTPMRSRWLVVVLLTLAAFMLTFEGVLEYRNPDKFTNACPQ